MLSKVTQVSFSFLSPTIWKEKGPDLKETINWAPVMFGGVFALSLFYYAVRGRFVYKGPVGWLGRSK